MLTPLSVAVVVLLVTYLLRKLYSKRFEQFAGFPQHPPSLLLGHLATIDEYVKKQPPKAHADMAFTAMHEALGRPPVMFVDLRPAASPMLIIGSYEAAEQLVKTSDRWPYTPPKAADVWKQLEYLTGPKSIISARGEEWKTLRKRFNPGFASQNLMELLPSILEKASLFVNRLDAVARTGEEFELQEYATDLTFDIIGRVVLDVDMDAQGQQPTEFMQVFRELIVTYSGEHIDLPWWCTPRMEWKRYRLHKRVRESLRAMVRSRHAEGSQGGNPCILSMSLRDIDSLTPELVDVTCDQLASFLFAGHDTTSTLMSWAFYELSRTPHALRAVRAELDDLFGPDTDPAAVRTKLLGPGGRELIHRMSYATAVIKETLRLWPPGATSRTTEPGDGFTIHTPSGELCVDGLMIYQVHSIIHRDPRAFGDTADSFVPERWLHDTDKIPAGAWRPFERGPRNCIGQELATIEARVLIALAARRFDFTKVGRGALVRDDAGNPTMGEHGQYSVASEMYM
ncbi:hypothetical protein SLS62_010498 [Diatrype stigma]|uniref:Cytochrome P450 n=1 Tax=Diatrype stigma TaxID=117547 RepID=A0AAN9YI22_9PEZI